MAEAAKIVSDLRAAFALKSPDLDKCADLVVAFKVGLKFQNILRVLVFLFSLSLLKLPILPPFDAKDSNLRQNLTTARDGLELAVLVSLHESDLIGFELNFIQLKPYYYDFASVLTESSQMWPILGLHLLCLLAQSRIAEFHTELELLPIASHTNKFIAYPIALEQELMEGSYRSLWDASSNVPFPEYRLFVDFLVEAARDNVSECAEKAYRELTLSDAATLFKLTDPEALNDFCSKRGWEVKNNIIHFRPVSDSTFFIPAQHLIKQGLGYATELERIV